MLNPYHPGPGLAPAFLAGRGSELAEAAAAAGQTSGGLGAAPLVYLGLRGVGKTVLLRAITEQHLGDAFVTIAVEAERARPFSEVMTESVAAGVKRFEKLGRRAEAAAKRLLAALPAVSFELPGGVGSLSLAHGTFDERPEVKSLVAAVGELSSELRAGGKALAITVDEAQEADLPTLRALLRAVHASLGTENSILAIFAGTPNVRVHLGRAHTYAERFTYAELTMLGSAETRRALVEPAELTSARFADDALQRLIELSAGYPYFVQLYGSYAWQADDDRIIDLGDVATAVPLVEKRLDDGFFRVRLDRLTPREIGYVLALGSLGPGPHAVSQVAELVGRTTREASSIRNNLVVKGVVYGPVPGAVAFSVPLFERFLERHKAELQRLQEAPRFDQRTSGFRGVK